MRALKLLSLFAVSLAFVGCAATGPKYKDISASIPPIPPGQARVFFYRPDTMLGAAVTSDIKLNGRVVGVSERGSFFFVDEAPGAMAVLTSTEVEKSLTFSIGAGERRFVKTSVSFGVMVGRIQPELVNATDAKADIAELAYTGNHPALVTKK